MTESNSKKILEEVIDAVVPASDFGTLIAITDEKDSTPRDERLVKSHLLRGIEGQEELPKALTNLKESLFNNQLSALDPKRGWIVVKNVGDSLILRADAQDNTPSYMKEFIRGCIEDLANIWRAAEQQNGSSELGPVRIVVHFSSAGYIIKGAHISSMCDSLRSSTAKLQLNLNSFFESLKSDIFGPGVNRAARLSHIPHAPLFILSIEAVSAWLLGKPVSYSDKLVEKTNNSQYNITEIGELLGPIPLVTMKGIDTIGMGRNKRPWWIWEFRPVQTNHIARAGNIRYKSLGAEQKQFQTLRILVGRLADVRRLRSRTLDDKEFQPIIEKFEKNFEGIKGGDFFYDFCIVIEEFWRLFDSRDDRNFERNEDKELKWFDDTDTELKFLPLYILISSVSNEDTDTVVRDILWPWSMASTEKRGIVPITYMIHRNIRLARKVDLEKLTQPDNRLYTIFFQIKQKELDIAHDPKLLFQDLHSKINIRANTEFQVQPLIWGATMGDKDGFLILRRSDPDREDENDFEAALREYLERSSKNNEGDFFSKIAPIRMYIGKSKKAIQHNNIEWLQSAIQ